MNIAFKGLYFLYDGQFSGNYGLQIMTINKKSTEAVDAGSGIEIFADSVYRNPTKFQYGVSQNQVLTFQMEILSEKPLSAIVRSKIQKWLFGRMSPCKLQIVQPDLQSVYFNCYLTSQQLQYIGSDCYGFNFTVECDAPWAWQLQKTYTRTNSTGTWKFYNDSDNTDYTYPIIEFKANSSFITSGFLSIINQSDGNREFRVDNLYANEVIAIDCNKQTITSSRGRLMSENFNKKFFRLVSGMNVLTLSGECSYIKIKYSNARKVGG